MKRKGSYQYQLVGAALIRTLSIVGTKWVGVLWESAVDTGRCPAYPVPVVDERLAAAWTRP
jgi:hypothetical protein